MKNLTKIFMAVVAGMFAFSCVTDTTEDLGVKLEIIDKAGAWFTVGEQRIQGRDGVKEFLRTHPDICDGIEQQIRDNAYKLMSPQARKAAQAAGRAVDISADDFEG